MRSKVHEIFFGLLDHVATSILFCYPAERIFQAFESSLGFSYLCHPRLELIITSPGRVGVFTEIAEQRTGDLLFLFTWVPRSVEIAYVRIAIHTQEELTHLEGAGVG